MTDKRIRHLEKLNPIFEQLYIEYLKFHTFLLYITKKEENYRNNYINIFIIAGKINKSGELISFTSDTISRYTYPYPSGYKTEIDNIYTEIHKFKEYCKIFFDELNNIKNIINNNEYTVLFKIIKKIHDLSENLI